MRIEKESNVAFVCVEKRFHMTVVKTDPEKYERFSIECHKTKPKPVTYELEYSAKTKEIARLLFTLD